MGYMHIENLYKDQTIFIFRECYALEKIHGRSADAKLENGQLTFFSGGINQETFDAIFPKDFKEKLEKLGAERVQVVGEVYGGSAQKKTSHIYGDKIKFIVFDVKIGDCWLSVPKAEGIALGLGLEFVSYIRTLATLDALNAARDLPSVQAMRNGCGDDKKREGIVIRPIEEMTMNNGRRIIAKHKNDDYKETATPREVSNEKLAILVEAKEIALEWVTEMRMTHVLDKSGLDLVVMNTGKVIPLMLEDIEREAEGEIVMSKEARVEITKATAMMFKQRVKNKI